MELFRRKITRPMNNTPGPVNLKAVTLEQHQHQESMGIISVGAQEETCQRVPAISNIPTRRM